MTKSDALDAIRSPLSRHLCRERDKGHVTWIDVRRDDGEEIRLIHVTKSSLVVHTKRIKEHLGGLRANLEAALHQTVGTKATGQGFSLPLDKTSQRVLVEVLSTTLTLVA